MHGPSLSDLPSELLDNILSQLSDPRHGYKNLYPLVLSNKRISSQAVKYMYNAPLGYEDPAGCHYRSTRTRDLFGTLISSMSDGSTYYPYHEYMQIIEVSQWGADSLIGPRKDLLGQILKSNKVRSLSFFVSNDISFLPKSCDFTALKDLSLNIIGNFKDVKAMARMKELTSQMRRLESLEIFTVQMPDSLEYLGFLDLQRDTLRSVSLSFFSRNSPDQGLVQRLLSFHCQSLRSVSVSSSSFAITSPLFLPNLQSIDVYRCQLVGWENICGSLTSLKNLSFYFTTIPGMHPFVPNPERLKTLNLDMFNEEQLAEKWLDEHHARFSRLLRLVIPRLPAQTFANVLKHSRTLVDLTCPNSRDEHLMALSKHAPASLKSLDTYASRFSELGLSAFVEAFPPSITRLRLAGSSGLTPSSFRCLLKLPSLGYLDIGGMNAGESNIPEMKEIAKKGRLPGLVVKSNFI